MTLDLHLPNHSSHGALLKNNSAIEELIIQIPKKGKISIPEEGREGLLELCIGVVQDLDDVSLCCSGDFIVIGLVCNGVGVGNLWPMLAQGVYPRAGKDKRFE